LRLVILVFHHTANENCCRCKIRNLWSEWLCLLYFLTKALIVYGVFTQSGDWISSFLMFFILQLWQKLSIENENYWFLLVNSTSSNTDISKVVSDVAESYSSRWPNLTNFTRKRKAGKASGWHLVRLLFM
jgi:hypothetical protein